MRAVHLRCEYLNNPIGIDITRPRFYWQAEDGERQSAYQIVCRRDGEVIWDSGKVKSSSMTHIRYEGEELHSRDIVTWQVRLWDEKEETAEQAAAESAAEGDCAEKTAEKKAAEGSADTESAEEATGGTAGSTDAAKAAGSADRAYAGGGVWSEPASFEIGLLSPSDWSAQWICGDVKDKKNVRFPVDGFRKDFEVRGDVKNARLYITACGLYEAKINGKLASDFCLAPGSTDYRKRIQYQTYNVTELLQESRNCKRERTDDSDVSADVSDEKESGRKNSLTIELADGWYRGSVGAMGLTHAYGRMTKLLFQLEIRYADGTMQTIASDGSVRWSNDGPIRFADLKDGEIVDARRQPSYSGWAKTVASKDIPAEVIVCASDNVFPRKKEHFKAKLITTPSGKKVLDFGQNIAGFVSFTAKGQKGQRIRLRMGEMLDENGEFTQKNIQLKVPQEDIGKLRELFVIAGASEKITKKLHMSPEQKIDFICSGEAGHYCTKFAVFGFRYAEVEAEFPVDPADFEAIAVYSDMEETGAFSCSNAKVNQLFHNTLWSMKSNFLDVPTDCPTRERLGWTGDAQIFFNTGAYLMDTASFFRKWLRDVEDSQNKKGQIPAVLPYSRADMMYNVSGNSVGWADAIVLIPCRYYQMYGDVQLLSDFYPMMRRYAEYMIRNTGHKKASEAKKDPNNKYVYEKGFHLGEWLEPEEFQEKIGTDTAGAATKMLHTEECTAYLHYTMAHMAEASRVLAEAAETAGCRTEAGDAAGKKAEAYRADAARYQEYADGAAKAYDALFLSPVPDTDRQAKLVRPLALGVVPEGKKKAVADRLVRAVENRQYCVGTGFLSTPFVLPTLTENGHGETAYRMLECEKYPSWLSEVNTGATTIWESWEGEVSRNHYSPGAVCEWLFDTTLGIKVDGENHFQVRPVPGGMMTYASGQYRSLYGTLKSSWKKTEDGYEYHIEVPANTTAEVVLPDGQTRAVTAGSWVFRTSPCEAT